MNEIRHAPLVRPRAGRVVAGVTTALAERTGIPRWVIRAGFVAGAIAGGLGIVAYVFAWGLIRSEGDAAAAPFRNWWDRRSGDTSRQAGWWILTVLGLSSLAAVSMLPAPFVVLAVMALIAWGMLDTEGAGA